MTQANRGRTRDGSADEISAELVRAAVTKYEGPLTIYAARLVGDVERAREVVQDTFLKLWTADQAEVKDHLAQWLYRVCRNRALDVCRKEVRMTTVDHEKLELRGAPPSHGADRQDANELEPVLAAMACLPERQQEVIRLKFQDGLSYQEIGNVMNLTANHVGVLIHTALKALRVQLKPAARQVQPIGPETLPLAVRDKVTMEKKEVKDRS